jgi:hypothetical protein
MKKLSSLCRAVTLAMLLPVGAANAGGLECAIRTALDGPKGAEVFLFDHTFDVHPPEIVEKQKQSYTMVGKLVHHSTAGKNETIAYRVTRQKGAIKEISLRINNGKWQAISEPMFNALGDWRTGEPMPEAKQRTVERDLEKAVDKSWLRAAEFLIANVAVRYC